MGTSISKWKFLTDIKPDLSYVELPTIGGPTHVGGAILTDEGIELTSRLVGFDFDNLNSECEKLSSTNGENEYIIKYF